jgi:simple sugar transport system ATP-binding protein
VRNLSGGNQQKLVLARELGSEPDLVVAESPTRGLDLKAAAEVRARLTSVRDRGAAVVVYSRDLEELLEIADRVVVVHASRVFEVPVRMEAMSRALVGISG